MFCTNCGKEIIGGAAFCTSCGTKVEEIPVKNTNTAVAAETAKKKYPTKLVICSILTAVVLVIIALAFGGKGSDGNVIEADNYNGMCFNYDLEEWTRRFNSAMEIIEDNIDVDDIKLKESSFELDNSDYDPTNAKIVRYVYTGSFVTNNDFAISLYVDVETEKISKCDIVYYTNTGGDLTTLLFSTVVPSLMATSNITDINEARSIISNTTSNTGDFYDKDTNTYYQLGENGDYTQFSIQPVSTEVYNDKY